VDLDLRKLNVLIGDQGTGKSTVAKVIDTLKYVCTHQMLRWKIEVYNSSLGRAESDIDKNKEILKLFSETIDKLELQGYLEDNTYMYFENESYYFVYENLKVSFENKLVLKNLGDNVSNDFNLFIPAYRESYILLRNSYPAILNAKAKLPYILNHFGQEFNNFREEIKIIDLNSILNITYQYKDGRDLIILKNGKVISFEESSSAINSVVPMLMVYLGIILEKSKKDSGMIFKNEFPFITIEEPELNCYPTTQKKLVEFLVEKMKAEDYLKSNEYYCSLLLTTHSPYILTSLNNLMYAFNTGKEHFEETDKIIPSKNWLNPNDVSAYRLNEGGISEDIFDREESLIKVEKIDEISTALNKDFNKLINIEIGLINEKH
jgi:hypothetical protein